MKVIPLVCFGALLLSVALTGCSGGGGTTPTGVTPATTLRTLQPGDHWTYSLSAQNIPGGTLDITVASVVFAGQNGISITSVTNIPALNQSATGVTYVRQDPVTHDLHYLGDNGGPGGAIRTVASESGVFVPGTWSATTNSPDHIVFTDNTSMDTGLAVQGAESKSTPLGTFPTWRATESLSLGGSQLHGVTAWFDPAVGGLVALQGSLTVSGQTINVSGGLTSTNVPLG